MVAVVVTYPTRLVPAFQKPMVPLVVPQTALRLDNVKMPCVRGFPPRTNGRAAMVVMVFVSAETAMRMRAARLAPRAGSPAIAQRISVRIVGNVAMFRARVNATHARREPVRPGLLPTPVPPGFATVPGPAITPRSSSLTVVSVVRVANVPRAIAQTMDSAVPHRAQVNAIAVQVGRVSLWFRARRVPVVLAMARASA